MQGEKKFEAKIHYGISLDEIVPSDHLIKRIESSISFEFVRDKTKDITLTPEIHRLILLS